MLEIFQNAQSAIPLWIYNQDFDFVNIQRLIDRDFDPSEETDKSQRTLYINIIGDYEKSQTILRKFVDRLKPYDFEVVLSSPELPIGVTLASSEHKSTIFITTTLVGFQTANILIFTDITPTTPNRYYDITQLDLGHLSLAAVNVANRNRNYSQKVYGFQKTESVSRPYGYKVLAQQKGLFDELFDSDDDLVSYIFRKAEWDTERPPTKRFYLDSLVAYAIPQFKISVLCAQTHMTCLLFQSMLSAVGLECKQNPPSRLGLELQPYLKSLIHLSHKFTHSRVLGDKDTEKYYASIPVVFDMEDQDTKFALFAMCNALSLLCGLTPVYDINPSTKKVKVVKLPQSEQHSVGFSIPSMDLLQDISVGKRYAGPKSIIYADNLPDLSKEQPSLTGAARVVLTMDVRGRGTQLVDDPPKPIFLASPNMAQPPTWVIPDAPLGAIVSEEHTYPTLQAAHKFPTSTGLYDALGLVPTIAYNPRAEVISTTTLNFAKSYSGWREFSSTIPSKYAGLRLVRVFDFQS